ncbi:helix-turn-helix domain-containing protein [Paenibacillus arenilitoris]|uniref:Helix-turn-helix transcriptional regulator n=1 Tax=Paenibacillus arenilitoris TaxID=2772299 RepID=A0A927CMK0_9BACL|nr:AraC family transcriptional regulator [Paenibacillus arenilitoris]MBD2869333.1 helix-turn-helix transcriptional regulator [Paenibacillus arenilitoris]
MNKDSYESLREPMDMPDPHFPIKVHRNAFSQQGQVTFPHHFHEHLEFLYIVQGEASIECGSTAITAKPGELIVVNSNELHYGISLSSDLFYYALIADISLLHSQSADAAETKFITPITQNRLLLRNHISEDGEAIGCVLSIIRELEQREFGYELAVKAELYRLMTRLLRGHVATVLTQVEHDERMKNLERFAPVFQHIENHYKDELSVDRLARMASLSRFHFSRLFKELTGHTVTEYVTMTRLNKADHLLRHSPLTISEIAAATGFNDIYYFSRTYKKHKQATPSSVRGN